MWPRVLWWAPVVWLLKESDSKICSWQVTHLEVHLNIPCWLGGMELSLVGGTSARTRRFLRLGGRLKAIIGSSGIARWRRSEVWRMWWLALVIWRMGPTVERDDRWQQEESSYWHSLGLWASQKVRIAYRHRLDFLDGLMNGPWTVTSGHKVRLEYLWMTKKVRVIRANSS